MDVDLGRGSGNFRVGFQHGATMLAPIRAEALSYGAGLMDVALGTGSSISRVGIQHDVQCRHPSGLKP